MLDVPLNAMWKDCEQEQTRTSKDQIESYDLLQISIVHEKGISKMEIRASSNQPLTGFSLLGSNLRRYGDLLDRHLHSDSREGFFALHRPQTAPPPLSLKALQASGGLIEGLALDNKSVPLGPRIEASVELLLRDHIQSKQYLAIPSQNH